MLSTLVAGAAEKLHPLDKKFMESAAMCGLFEAKAAELAAAKGSAAQVRELGRMMTQDQAAAAEKLKELAKLHEIELPAILNPSLTKILDGMAKWEGATFDRKFLLYMVDYQDAYLRIFTDESEIGKDAALKQFAGEAAAAVQKQIDFILKAQEELKITADS
jgi:predicted outer membrane protein